MRWATMQWIHRMTMAMRTLFGRGRADAELDAELREHLERQTEENRAAGMALDEARCAALRSFGNPALLREQTRATWSWGWLESLGRDLRYGARTLRRSPGFSLTAVAVMALCIGAATSLFTIVRSVLLRPLPFRDPGKLVMVYEHFRAAAVNLNGFNYNTASPADFYDWRSQTHGFEDMAAWRSWEFNLTGERGELPEKIEAAAATSNLIPLLGVQPAVGRGFTRQEDQPGGKSAMLTWSLFVRRFASDPSIVGRQIHLDGQPYTVVGVLPASFTYPDAKVQIWVPYAAVGDPENLRHHDYHQSYVIARLRPGTSLASAISQVEAVQYRLHMQYLNAPVAEDVAPRSISDDLSHNVKKPLLILMGAVLCMLLIGCLNIANLLVARGAARQKEVAIRGALGARRLALLREQLTESLLICVTGGITGIALSVAATRWLAHTWRNLPTAAGIHLDGAVVAFACGLIFVAALLAGLLPAISATAMPVFAVLNAGSRTAAGHVSRTALRKTLLTAEIAVTVVLLIAAGLLMKSFVQLRNTGVGCTTDRVLTMGFSLPAQKYDSPQKVNVFLDTLLERLRAMQEVQAVGLGSILPGAGWGGDDIFTVAEHPPLQPGALLPDALYRRADPDYFRALQIPLLRGRFFTGDDRLDRANKIIISQRLAKQYFPSEDPIGRHMRVPAHGTGDYEVVGVVGDTLYRVGQESRPTMYFPVLSGESDVGLSLVIRTVSDPLRFSVPAQKVFASLDPELPVSDVLTLPQVIGETLDNASLSATLVLAFAALSLLLAAVGLFGVLSYLVAQRSSEIGIRIAMGAQREQVLRLMLADGMRPALLGLVIGLGAGAVAVRVIRSMLYETQPVDPLIFSGVAVTLLLVAALACLLPAWRASRLDPIQALRIE